MKAFNKLTKKQKILGLIALGLLLFLAFFYNSDLIRPKDRAITGDQASQLKEEENQDLESLTGTSKITGINITSDKDQARPGDQVQFTAQLDGEGDFDSTVLWEITSPHHDGSQISPEGLLQIDPQEDIWALTIRATSQEDQTQRAYKDLAIIKDQASPTPAPAQESKPQAQAPTKADLKQKAAQAQKKITPQEKAQREKKDRALKQQAIAKSSAGVKDKYQTDPTPAGKPKPIEPENQVKTGGKATCSLSIRCDTILNNMDRFDMDKIDVLPTDGVILPPTTVEFEEGDSVFDILNRETKARKIHMESNFTPAYNSAYVMGIHNLYEFDTGELSGWMYKVNGWFPNYGCSRYQVKPGDKIEWVYTCDLGRDVGDNSMTK